MSDHRDVKVPFWRISEGLRARARHQPGVFVNLSSAYTSAGAVFITWDESEQGGHPIGLIALSPFAKAGYAGSISYSHSSTLRTVQTIFGVQSFLGDAANASDLSDLFQ
jgi:hypothetical protein